MAKKLLNKKNQEILNGFVYYASIQPYGYSGKKDRPALVLRLTQNKALVILLTTSTMFNQPKLLPVGLLNILQSKMGNQAGYSFSYSYWVKPEYIKHNFGYGAKGAIYFSKEECDLIYEFFKQHRYRQIELWKAKMDNYIRIATKANDPTMYIQFAVKELETIIFYSKPSDKYKKIRNPYEYICDQVGNAKAKK